MFKKVAMIFTIAGSLFNIYSIDPISGFSGIPWGTKKVDIISKLSLTSTDSLKWVDSSSCYQPIFGNPGHVIYQAIMENNYKLLFRIDASVLAPLMNSMQNWFKTLYVDTVSLTWSNNSNPRKYFMFNGDSLIGGWIENPPDFVDVMTTLKTKYGSPMPENLFYNKNLVGESLKYDRLWWHDANGEISLITENTGEGGINQATIDAYSKGMHKNALKDPTGISSNIVDLYVEALKEQNSGEMKIIFVCYISHKWLLNQSQSRIKIDAEFVADQKADSEKVQKEKIEKMKSDY